MRIPTTPVREHPLEPLDLGELARAASNVAANALAPASTPTTGETTAAGSGRVVPSRATFLRSFVHAWDGVMYALRTQRNARVHLLAAVCALTLGVALRISAIEFALLFLAIMAVLVAELFNTVAEAVVDLVTSEFHPLARIAKDVAAGAVLLCALFAVIIGVLVFGPHLWPLAAHLVAR
jgi:diacylglycerol kinase